MCFNSKNKTYMNGFYAGQYVLVAPLNPVLISAEHLFNKNPVFEVSFLHRNFLSHTSKKKKKTHLFAKIVLLITDRNN